MLPSRRRECSGAVAGRRWRGRWWGLGKPRVKYRAAGSREQGGGGCSQVQGAEQQGAHRNNNKTRNQKVLKATRIEKSHKSPEVENYGAVRTSDGERGGEGELSWVSSNTAASTSTSTSTSTTTTTSTPTSTTTTTRSSGTSSPVPSSVGDEEESPRRVHGSVYHSRVSFCLHLMVTFRKLESVLAPWSQLLIL